MTIERHYAGVYYPRVLIRVVYVYLLYFDNILVTEPGNQVRAW